MGLGCIEGIDHHIVLQRLNEINITGLQFYKSAVALYEHDIAVAVLVLHKRIQQIAFLQYLGLLLVLIQRHFDRRVNIDLLEWLTIRGPAIWVDCILFEVSRI